MSSSKSSKSSKQFHKNSGDWFCPDKACNNLNFARRDSCNRCNKPREEQSKKKGTVGIGNVMAKSSKGLFSADDWACTKCGNINWARRNQCNICNAKKFVEEDERTGLGGGFNEREKVEYKQRRSSDSDEYDEFGRRKKNKRKKSTSDVDLKRKSSRRDRSSSSSDSSSSRSNSPVHKNRKISHRSRSRSREDRHRKTYSHEQYREKSKEKEQSKSPSRSEKSERSNESDDSEDDGDEDLSKYNLFDDDFEIEALKAKK